MEAIRKEEMEMDFINEEGLMRDLTEEDLVKLGLDRKGKWQYTVADIEALPEGIFAELIDGEIFVRMEAPSTIHQEIQMNLSFQLELYIRRKKGKCRLFPTLGVLPKCDIHNLVIPDISLICNEEKLDKKGCNGAPDLVIEIVSPSNKKHDYVTKLALYKEAGVREYWIVDPKHERVTVYDLEHEKDPVLHPFSERIKVRIYDDLYLDITDRSGALEEVLTEERTAAQETGREEGLKAGRAEGETRLAELTAYLLREGRMEDLEKALADPQYREKLLREELP